MSVHFLVFVALCLASLASALPRSPRSSTVLHPHHLRVGHHLTDTHPDLVVDSPHPAFSWQLQTELQVDGSPLRGTVQTAFRIQLLPFSPSGVVSSTPLPLGDTGLVHSNASTQVQHPLALRPNTRYLLRVQYHSSTGGESEWAQATFRTAMMDTWRDVPAQWIGSRMVPMNQVKKDFTLPSSSSASLTSATVAYSGIGYSTLWVNNKVVDPTRKLDPAWTTYQKRTLYVSLDVSQLLTSGLNTVAVELGNGWYAPEQFLNEERFWSSYGPPRLWLHLQANYSDGSSVSVVSDASWLGTQGPTVHDGVYMGSISDHRWNRSDWAKPGHRDPYTLWVNASVMSSPLNSTGVFALQPHDPVRTPPANLHVATSGRGNPSGVVGGDLIRDQGGMFHPKPVPGGVEGQVLDLGQNVAGWCRFRARGMRGMSLMVRYSESLSQRYADNPEVKTSLYTENLRNAAATDMYIFAEDMTYEWFEPPFTVHGFRYVEFRGAMETIRSADVECLLVHSETTLVGNFTSSSHVMNQIQHNTQWGQLSNLMGIPTDCPQRDERKGWMGDAALSVDESLFNFDTPLFYVNFLNEIRDIQKEDGQVPNTVPEANGGFPADPNWGTAYPTILWTLWRHYGDRALLMDHYAGAKKWVEYVRSDMKAHGLGKLHYDYGDWVPPPPFDQTNRQLIAAFPFLRDVTTIIKIATVLNDSATVSDYTQLYANLSSTFHSLWYNSSNLGYADGMQAANVLALALPSVVPDDLQGAVVKALVNDLRKHGHLTTGIVGTANLFPVLSANGQHDLALQLAQSTTYPSYGWMFTNGIENATTLWELWDSPLDTVDGPGMDSRNHIMFGSISAWFYRDVAGINLDGLELIDIRPRMGLDASLMPEVHAEVVTVKGPVTVDYVRAQTGAATIDLTVQVPVNSRAAVHFEPLVAGGRCALLTEGGVVVLGREGEGVRESVYSEEGLVVSGVEGVTEDAETGVVRVEVGAGTFHFTARWQ